MCEYCEPSKHGICTPMAFNDIGFKVPLVDLWLDNEKRNNRIIMLVHYDESEPLELQINFCPMCGRDLREYKKCCGTDSTNAENANP